MNDSPMGARIAGTCGAGSATPRRPTTVAHVADRHPRVLEYAEDAEDPDHADREPPLRARGRAVSDQPRQHGDDGEQDGVRGKRPGVEHVGRDQQKPGPGRTRQQPVHDGGDRDERAEQPGSEGHGRLTPGAGAALFGPKDLREERRHLLRETLVAHAHRVVGVDDLIGGKRVGVVEEDATPLLDVGAQERQVALVVGTVPHRVVGEHLGVERPGPHDHGNALGTRGIECGPEVADVDGVLGERSESELLAEFAERQALRLALDPHRTAVGSDARELATLASSRRQACP